MAMTAESLRGPLYFPIDLKTGLAQQPIRPQLMKGDKKANTIIVALTEGGKPADLTGVTVTGSFIAPPDGAEIPLVGSVNGNEASVTLADECYAADGYFEINIKLTLGETSRTILSITGHVLSKGSGAVIDVGNVIPSIDDIIAQYQTMKEVTASTQAAGTAATNAAKNANDAAGTANTAAQSAQAGAAAANAAAKNWGDSTAANSEKLGGKLPAYYSRPRNLLINTNLRNPINSRGLAVYDTSTASKYGLDNWWLIFAEYTVSTRTLRSNHETYGAVMRQIIEPSELYAGQPITFAVRYAGSDITAGMLKTSGINVSGGMVSVSSNATGSNGLVVINATVPNDIGSSAYPYLMVTMTIPAGESTVIDEIMLFEGTFTRDTLPKNVTNPYSVELNACRGRVVKIARTDVYLGIGTASADTVQMFIPTHTKLQGNGVFTITPGSGINGNVRVYSGAYNLNSAATLAAVSANDNGILLSLKSEGQSIVNPYANCAVQITTDVIISSEIL